MTYTGTSVFIAIWIDDARRPSYEIFLQLWGTTMHRNHSRNLETRTKWKCFCKTDVKGIAFWRVAPLSAPCTYIVFLYIVCLLFRFEPAIVSDRTTRCWELGGVRGAAYPTLGRPPFFPEHNINAYLHRGVNPPWEGNVCWLFCSLSCYIGVCVFPSQTNNYKTVTICSKLNRTPLKLMPAYAQSWS